MSIAPETLQPVERRITQEQLVQYADASGDHNPLHLDEEFARGTPYGRTIAHGMLVLALVSELMTRSFGGAWLRGGRLKTRFRAPVFPGDTVCATGMLKASDENSATYEVTVSNEDGENVITGDASVALNA